MNRHLEKAILSLGKASVLINAYEQLYLDISFDVLDAHTGNMAAYTFYAVKDSIEEAVRDVDLLTEDAHLADVVYAVNKSN